MNWGNSLTRYGLRHLLVLVKFAGLEKKDIWEKPRVGGTAQSSEGTREFQVGQCTR